MRENEETLFTICSKMKIADHSQPTPEHSKNCKVGEYVQDLLEILLEDMRVQGTKLQKGTGGSKSHSVNTSVV